MDNYYEEEPPPITNTLRQPTSVRIRSSSSVRSITRRREMDFLCHLSSPQLVSRLRNDSFILAPDGWFYWKTPKNLSPGYSN